MKRWWEEYAPFNFKRAPVGENGWLNDAEDELGVQFAVKANNSWGYDIIPNIICVQEASHWLVIWVVPRLTNRPCVAYIMRRRDFLFGVSFFQ